MFGYIGNSPAYGLFEKQVLTTDGVQDSFPLLFKVGNSTSILVIKDGAVLQSGVGNDYTVTAGGTVISFDTAPLGSEEVFLIYLGRELLVPRAEGIWDSGSWVPTITGDGGMDITDLTIHEAKFMEIGDTVKYKLDITLTPDAPLTDTIIFTLPVEQGLSENVVAPVKIDVAGDLEHGHLSRRSSTEMEIHREEKVDYTNEVHRIQISGEFDKS